MSKTEEVFDKKIKEAKEALDKDTFGAATFRVVIRVLLVYIIIWFFQRMAGP